MCVCVSVCLARVFDWLCHTGRISRCEQPAFVWCLFHVNTSISERRTEKSDTPGQNRARQTGATPHSDWVQPIIQYHEEVGTPGIDSQVKGEQDTHIKQQQPALSPFSLELWTILLRAVHLYTLLLDLVGSNNTKREEHQNRSHAHSYK